MGRYSESHESGRAFIGDGMEVKRNADIPMSAMWTPDPGPTTSSIGYNADIRESASVAHIYGQNLVAAESLTAGSGAWSLVAGNAEADRRQGTGDGAEPLRDPHLGASAGERQDARASAWGRSASGSRGIETWAEMAKPWTTYLARSSYMLQQGKFVADIVYFYGEDSNITALVRRQAAGGAGRLQLRLRQRRRSGE